jgi:hypothetical protein
MAEKQFDMTPNGPVKKPGWFSWRHADRTAHDLAQVEHGRKHGKEQRVARCQERGQYTPPKQVQS